MRTGPAGFVAALALLLIAVPAAADATFASAAMAIHAVSSDTLDPPSGVAVKCKGSALRATVSWTATADRYATGYTVYVKDNGTESAQSVPGGGTTSYASTVAVPAGAVVTMVSVYRNWTSVRTAGVVAPASCH